VLAPQNDIQPLAEAATLDETSAGLLVTFGFAILVVFWSFRRSSKASSRRSWSWRPCPGACLRHLRACADGAQPQHLQPDRLVMLIGIMAKNGILIVEFANQLRDAGENVRDAILNASTIRLRPVMMTMISTVLGACR
jgi:HAE1 family hydrophobic/amphiphilic exporter-1